MSTTLKWVLKVDFIFGNEEFYISTPNPTSSNGSPLVVKTTSTNLKWVSKVDFIVLNGEFYFSTHSPTSFKLGPGM
jgi:hypothetical protein